MPLTIRVSEHSQSTGSDRTPEHSDDEEFSAGVPVDSLSTGSQVDYSDDDDREDEFVHIRYRHVRRNTHGGADDIEPSDSASRPGTSRQSSQQRAPRGEPPRGHSRRRNPAPDPPTTQPRPARGGPREPRGPPAGRAPRPDSFHSDSLAEDDYPYGPGYGRPGPAPGWGHIPSYGGYGEPSVLTAPDPFAGQDMMAPYRDPYYERGNPFAPQAPFDDMYDMPPPRRPRPQARHSMGPPARDFALMPYGRDPYGYDPYRDHWGYGRRPPMPPDIRSLSPEKHPHGSKPPTPAGAMPPVAVPVPVPSPGDERLKRLEDMIMMQNEEARKRQLEKMALKADEERKKKEAEEKTQSEKLIALEKLLLKQNEEAIAREKAAEKKQAAAEASAAAKLAKEAAEKAATDKIAKELQEAADKAKKATQEEADKKAKEAKEAADKELAAMKEKHDAAEEAKKKAEEEAANLKPKGVIPPVKFKDAVGRKFQFPFEVCKTWKGMEGLIRQAFLHVDLLGPHVLEGHFDLIGPDGEIILPQVWETMIKPDFSIEMQMWPIPELEKGKQKHPHGIPGMPPGMAGMHGMHGMPPGGPPGAMPAIEDILKGLPGGPGGKSGKRDKKHDKKGAHGKIMMPPPPPLGSVIPPPPGALPLHGPPGGFPHGMPPPPMDPIGGPGGVMPGLGDLSLGGYDDLERKKSRKKKGEVPALMRWAGGQRRKK